MHVSINSCLCFMYTHKLLILLQGPSRYIIMMIQETIDKIIVRHRHPNCTNYFMPAFRQNTPQVTTDHNFICYLPPRESANGMLECLSRCRTHTTCITFYKAE